MSDFHIIILAAGESKRMGEPKQLLVYNGQTLLERTFHVASKVAADHITIVLGANSEKILETIPVIKDVCVYNKHWGHGMGASISYGLQSVLKSYPSTGAVIFMTTDQPYITADHLQHLVRHYKSSSEVIVASSYDDTTGIPALFTAHFFPGLLMLQTEKGAKDIISDNRDKVVLVPFAAAATDVDTRVQYNALDGNEQRI
jgi:molybdenum cofactor cytidylyltransferase